MAFLRLTELHPHGVTALAGAPLPQCEVHFFRMMGPPVVPTFENEHVRIESVDRVPSDTPFAPLWVFDLVRHECLQHPRGESCIDPDAVDRRVAEVRRATNTRAPKQGLSAEIDTLIPLVDGMAIELLESFALPPDIVVSLIQEILGVAAGLATVRVRKMASEPLALWPWDERGKALDEKAKHEESARLRAEKEAAEQVARDAMPNEKTCKELGLLVTRRAVNQTSSDLCPGGSVRRGEFHPKHGFLRDGFSYAVFDACTLLGLEIPATHLPVAGEILSQDFVIPLSNKELRELPRPHAYLRFLDFRKQKLDTSPISEFRDLRSPDGAWAVKCVEERFARFAQEILAKSFTLYVENDGTVKAGRTNTSAYLALLVHAYARTCIRADVAWNSFATMLTDAWETLHPNREEVTKREQLLFIDSRGAEHNRPSQEGPQGPLDAYGEPMAVTRVAAVMWKRPPMPFTQDEFLSLYRVAVNGGPNVLIGKDELFTAPEPGFASRMLDLLRYDPWRDVLAELTKKQEPVFTDDIEDALRDAGLLTGRMNDYGYTRVANLMKKLGREKKQPTIDGKRRAAWVVA